MNHTNQQLGFIIMRKKAKEELDKKKPHYYAKTLKRPYIFYNFASFLEEEEIFQLAYTCKKAKQLITEKTELENKFLKVCVKKLKEKEKDEEDSDKFKEKEKNINEYDYLTNYYLINKVKFNNFMQMNFELKNKKQKEDIDSKLKQMQELYNICDDRLNNSDSEYESCFKNLEKKDLVANNRIMKQIEQEKINSQNEIKKLQDMNKIKAATHHNLSAKKDFLYESNSKENSDNFENIIKHTVNLVDDKYVELISKSNCYIRLKVPSYYLHNNVNGISGKEHFRRNIENFNKKYEINSIDTTIFPEEKDNFIDLKKLSPSKISYYHNKVYGRNKEVDIKNKKLNLNSINLKMFNRLNRMNNKPFSY